MKKIVSFLVLIFVFVATASAQYITVYENETLIRKYDMQEHTYEVTFEKHNPLGEEVQGNGKINVYEGGQLIETFIDRENYSYKVTRENVVREGAMANINGEQVFVEYVQLWDGGPKWATMNVGATEVAGTKKNSHTGKLDCYGEYYAWGETSPKDNYSWASYKWMAEGQSTEYFCTKYTFADNQTSASWYKDGTYVGTTVDGKTYTNLTQLELADDAANANWGGDWRMPTYSEQQELTDSCYWEWADSYDNTGVTGYIVYKVKNASDKGKKKYSGSSTTTVGSYSLSDNHIFLPAAGYRIGTKLLGDNSYGVYWSSSLSTSVSNNTSQFDFNMEVVSRNNFDRCEGQSVRAVCP